VLCNWHTAKDPMPPQSKQPTKAELVGHQAVRSITHTTNVLHISQPGDNTSPWPWINASSIVLMPGGLLEAAVWHRAQANNYGMHASERCHTVDTQ